jgi:hypothetical protein
MERAVNPSTGEVVFLVNNQWVKPTDTAKNEAGDSAFLVGNQWQIVKAATPAAEKNSLLGSPMGEDFGSAIMAAASPKKQSVLEGIDMPEPTFNPAEANRLSRRDYAEEQAQKFDPRYQQKVTQGGPRKAPSAAELAGGMMQDANPLLRVGEKAKQGGAELIGGLLRAVGDITGSDTLAGTGEYMGKNAQEYQQAMGPAITGDIQGFGPKSVVPDVLKYTAEMGEGAASSLAQSIAASALGPGAVLPALSAMSGFSQYNKARDAGLSASDASINAALYALSEYGGGKFVGLDKAAFALKNLVNQGASTEAKKQAGDTLFKMGVREIPGELATYLGQTGVDLLPGIGLNPNLTMDEFVAGLRDTAVQAAMMGGAAGGAGKYLQSRASQGAPQAAPSVDQVMTGRELLTPESKPQLTAPAPERIEPTFEPEKPLPTEPTDEKQKRVRALEQKILELGGDLPPVAEETSPTGLISAQPVTAPAVAEPTTNTQDQIEAKVKAAIDNRIENNSSVQAALNVDPIRAAIAAKETASTEPIFSPDIREEYPALSKNEVEELGLIPKPKVEKVKEPKVDYLNHPENIGSDASSNQEFDNKGKLQVAPQNISDGGVPFKSKAAAAEARKNYPDMRVLQTINKQGFILAPKTPKQIAADEAKSKRLGMPITTAKGMPMAAHQFIASEGGITKNEMNDLNAGENVRVGNRRLFTDSGMSMDRAYEKLQEAGYLEEGADENSARNLIMESVKTPKYRPQDAEEMAARETQANYQDYLKAEEEASLYSPVDEEMGYEMVDFDGTGYESAGPEIQAEVRALLAQADALGINTESIQEDIFYETENQSIQAYYAAFKSALEDAVTTGNQDRIKDTGQPSGEGVGFELTAQTPDEIKAKQAEAERLTKENEQLNKEAERKAKADEQAGDFVLTGSNREADQAAARGQQSFLDISSGPVVNEEKKRNPSLKRKLDKLNRDREGGKITDEAFIDGVDTALDDAAKARMYAQRPPRTRGADFIRQRLLEAKRRGDLSDEAVDFAEWFIQRNPQLVEDLGISIRAPKEGGVAGQYFDYGRLMVLMKKKAKDNTAVHEILHHLERMMPEDMQNAIRKAWTKEFSKAKQGIENKAQQEFFKLLGMYHWHGEGREVDFEKAVQMVKDGQVPSSFYQYVNPSEFWAVNGTDIMQGRFDAVRGGVLARLKNWLKELGQKISSMVGMGSQGKLINALDSLSKGDGKFQSKEMLSESSTYASPEEPSKQEAAEEKRPGLLSRAKALVFEEDKLKRNQLTVGVRAHAVVANIANNVLDKFKMKPISPELNRAMKNMKAKVDAAKSKAADVAAEMNALSPEERELISDVIEGELKAGVHPPQYVLDIAAAIQSMMSRQSKELVDLGMLSKEAVNRWDNKYLPRFYEQQLSDSVSAWAKAAREVFMKQPLMRGIRGSNLRSRGIFQEAETADLQSWIDDGWEQRDPTFDPKKSKTTIVWRDYTREERENMGEIRDAMFRFVMGYNTSQRDIALGRLYKELAQSYASSQPLEGYVEVPSGKAEGTNVPRYGALEGLYVPKEIMDHLSANDHAMAEGILKIYRAGMSKWKEGKTVLNPVAHANNVMSNLTMAHFAGVSYWDAHKYAGAIKDLAKNDDMVKEAKEVGLFGGTFNQAELMKSMPPELRAMANMTDSALSRYGERIWDTMAFTVEVGGKKYGARPAMQWAYENEDSFFRYLIYRDARNRGMNPEDARDYSQEFIFTYDDLPQGARMMRDYAMPFFGYTYKVVPVLASTALKYPWRFAAPATAAYTANAMMYAIAANLGGDEDDWWGKVFYKYITDPVFRKKAKDIEANERKYLPEWMKGHSMILATPKAIRMGVDEATKLPMFLDISRIFPGGDLLDANNNAGGVAMIQPLMPSNPVFNVLVAMLGNKDLFFGKDVTDASDNETEKLQKRGAWLWKQAAPAIAIGNYHFDKVMNAMATAQEKPININAGPLGVVSYTGVGKDTQPIQPKHVAMQMAGIKIKPYDLTLGQSIQEGQKKKLIRELNTKIGKLNRYEGRGVISAEAANAEREALLKKRSYLREGLTLEGEEKE